MTETLFQRHDKFIDSVEGLGKLELFNKPKHCIDCRCWIGRCLRGRKNKIAWSPSCEKFEPTRTLDLSEEEISTVAAFRLCPLTVEVKA